MAKTTPRAASFEEYASLPDLTPDETWTIELLIDRVRSDFDPNYWENWQERQEARESPKYQPQFLKNHIEPAAKALKKIRWLSFQRLCQAERPVRDLYPLRYLPELSGLVLTGNEVSDLSPLKSCPNLRELHLQKNPIRDIGPLASCLRLEKLSLAETPIDELSVLELLPELKELSIAADLVTVVRKVKRFAALEKLEFGLDSFDSFKNFPEMPKLRVIRGAQVKSLEGLEKFPALENLENLSGEFETLEPLRKLRFLTHANIQAGSIRSLEPLSDLTALRRLWLGTTSPQVDLTPLEGLPALHDVTIKCENREVEGLAHLRAQLSSWDVEFREEKARHTPCLEVVVIDQETFDYFDTKKRYNLTENDRNHGLLTSELEWLDGQLEEMFAPDFKEGEDYTLPFRWAGGRSRTVVLSSDEAVSAFSRLVLRMQEILSHVRQDWILYFQSDDATPEFIVWVYPDRILTTPEYADVVRELIKPE